MANKTSLNKMHFIRFFLSLFFLYLATLGVGVYPSFLFSVELLVVASDAVVDTVVDWVVVDLSDS